MADRDKPSPAKPKQPSWYWDPDPQGRMTSPQVRRRLGLIASDRPADRRGIVGFRIPPSPRYAMEQAVGYEDRPTLERLRKIAIPETSRLEPRRTYGMVVSNPDLNTLSPRITRRPPGRRGRRQ